MINLKYEGKKNIFKKEMVYLFFKENELINFYNEKVYEALKTKTLLKFIHDFLEHLLIIYKNTFRKEIIAVIDNFDEDDEDKLIILNKIIELVKKESNLQKMRLIISGRCQYMYNQQMFYLKNELNMESQQIEK